MRTRTKILLSLFVPEVFFPRSVSSGTQPSGYSPAPSSGQSEVDRSEGPRACDRPLSISRIPEVSGKNRARLSVPLVLLFVVALGVSAQYIDYRYLAWVVKMELTGEEVTCLNLPGEHWRLYEACGGGEVNNFGYPR